MPLNKTNLNKWAVAVFVLSMGWGSWVTLELYKRPTKAEMGIAIQNAPYPYLEDKKVIANQLETLSRLADSRS